MIRVRGAAVHNLQHIDLDLQHGRLVAFCGVSGSGKSSLALDTLYAEGQRRYIESFSTYTRQFLEQLDKPPVESIEGIPPSVAVTRKNVSRSSRATVGSATQINEHLQLLFARIGQVVCDGCGQTVHRDTVDSIAETLAAIEPGRRIMIGFPARRATDQSSQEFVEGLLALGYRRAIYGHQTVEVTPHLAEQIEQEDLAIVLDRLTSGGETARLADSLENAMDEAGGVALVWIAQAVVAPRDSHGTGQPTMIDGQPWQKMVFSRQLRCEACDLQYPDPEPQLFNYNSPHGACPACEGFGNLVEVDLDLVIPDQAKSLREGAIAPWNTPAYAHELEELLSLAPDYDLPLDVPYGELTADQRRLIKEGVPERDFGGLDGFFAWLERRKYKVHIRVFLSRWRSYAPCPTCHGARLHRGALAVRIGGLNIAELCALKIHDAKTRLAELALTPRQHEVAKLLLQQVASRLNYLDEVGVGHLSIDRPLRTLGGGESQRVALTSALGSNLTGMLYVLDEPSAGLHPADMPKLVRSVRQLCQRGNTVAVVEHDVSLIREADEVVELGPGAGELGGKIVFQGTPNEMLECPHSRTGDWISGRRLANHRATRRDTNQGWIRLVGARGNNLKNLTVEFPLGVLCVVTGVSGAGKTSLVQQTLFQAVAQKLRLDSEPPAPFDDILGTGQLEDAILVDQSPIGRTPRSNPVTYVKAFDPIRNLFAETMEAKSRGFKAGHFSFNVDGGRCEACQGDGSTRIDMRFMADVYMTCAECQGARYRREVLDVKYRGLSIDEVLQLSVREAFTFFRGHKKIQSRLKCLIDVGLEYLRLGQPANTLSSGEAQRLKLSNYVAAMRRGRTLFVLDEPTAGLHHSDVMQLLDCFDSLLAMGHSLIVVEHHSLITTAADHLIDLGPGAAGEGGQIVAEGTPEEVATVGESATGQYLAHELERIASQPQE
jgi:excinuclease ABC subunit A